MHGFVTLKATLVPSLFCEVIHTLHLKKRANTAQYTIIHESKASGPKSVQEVSLHSSEYTICAHLEANELAINTLQSSKRVTLCVSLLSLN